jgi:hypothetical protein
MNAVGVELGQTDFIEVGNDCIDAALELRTL